MFTEAWCGASLPPRRAVKDPHEEDLDHNVVFCAYAFVGEEQASRT